MGRHVDDRERPFLLWRLPAPMRAAASAPLGGGIGDRAWVLNAQVDLHYERTDPDAHLAEIAATAGLSGPGLGLLTAAELVAGQGEEEGVVAWATVGVTTPTWAADADDAAGCWEPGAYRAGTINIVAFLPVALADAALVNAVMTVTEAKTQALVERGVPGTGTASDAVCVLAAATGRAEPFAGPRSPWGARLARAVHAAVAERLA